MANYKTVFLGSEKSETTEKELQCYDNSINEIFISITNTSIEHDYNEQFISLDISTAIKLAKTLRTHINLIKEI
jgi:hypothetical protein